MRLSSWIIKISETGDSVATTLNGFIVQTGWRWSCMIKVPSSSQSRLNCPLGQRVYCNTPTAHHHCPLPTWPQRKCSKVGIKLTKSVTRRGPAARLTRVKSTTQRKGWGGELHHVELVGRGGESAPRLASAATRVHHAGHSTVYTACRPPNQCTMQATSPQSTLHAAHSICHAGLLISRLHTGHSTYLNNIS